MANDRIVCYVTAPDEAGEEIARDLVEKELAACVNIIAPVRSIYKWKGSVEDDPEVLLIVKSTQQCLDALTERVKNTHPYDVPEVVAVPITGGSDDYLKWVDETCTAAG